MSWLCVPSLQPSGQAEPTERDSGHTSGGHGPKHPASVRQTWHSLLHPCRYVLALPFSFYTNLYLLRESGLVFSAQLWPTLPAQTHMFTFPVSCLRLNLFSYPKFYFWFIIYVFVFVIHTFYSIWSRATCILALTCVTVYRTNWWRVERLTFMRGFIRATLISQNRTA